MGDLIKGILYLGFSGYMALNLFGVFLGFGKDVSYVVKSNANIVNVKVIELEVKNTSSKWLDYTFSGSDIDINSTDFTLLDAQGNVLDADGRSDDGIQNLRRGKQRIIQLVFVDDQNKIDQYNDLDIYSDTEKIEKAITLPAAVHITTPEELLQKVFTTKGAEQDAAIEEFKNSMMNGLIGNDPLN